MVELKVIHKKRRLSAIIANYSLAISLTLLIASLFLENQLTAFAFWGTTKLILLGVLVSTSIYLTFLNWFPIIENHKEHGTLIFDKDAITRTVYKKKETFSVSELSEVKFNIFGHHGQNISSMPRILIADGTGNFVTLHGPNFMNRKIEFYLDTERNLNTLRRYIDDYKTLTKVQDR
jgi:hypothetical protein